MTNDNWYGKLADALEEYRQELLDNEDVVDGVEGQPRPNWAMEARLLLDRILWKYLKGRMAQEKEEKKQ